MSPPSPPPLPVARGVPSEPINYMEKARGQAETPNVALNPSLLAIPREHQDGGGSSPSTCSASGDEFGLSTLSGGTRDGPSTLSRQPLPYGSAGIWTLWSQAWAPGHTPASARSAAGAGEGTELLPPTLCGNHNPALLNARPFLTLTRTLRQGKLWTEH